MDYYIIMVRDQFVANRYCETAFTTDEEEAYAYTSYEQAANANTMGGRVYHRTVTDDDLLEIPTEAIYLF